MEIWRAIKGFEGLYEISSCGHVRSLNRALKDSKGRVIRYKGKMLCPQPNSKGYLRVQLKKNGKYRYFFVHRLVALHFVDNPLPTELTIVNHIDSNYLNNRADNLEWTTYRGNIIHAIKNGRMNRTEKWLQRLRESNEKNGKKVIGTNIATGNTVTFICLNDCKAAGFQPSCVCQCCQGKRISHKGFAWRYA